MGTAFDVARCLIDIAASEEEPEYLSHLRLQKLLYYTQAWSLALRGKPMFEDQIEAWANGPVVRTLYSTFSPYGYGSIAPGSLSFECSPLDGDDYDFVAGVWESYKGYSATSLRDMTHNETPWIEARKGYAPGERCNVPITHEAMRSYFASQQN